MARDNRTLGKFHLDGIPPAPRGVPQVEVTFDLDANGIVNVSAKDKATSKQQHITITASSGLSKDEVERMVSDAASHEAEDKARKEAIEARNQLDSLVYNTQKFLDENREKVPEGDRVSIEEALSRGRDVLEKNKDSTDAAPLRAALEEIQKASHKMAEQIYRAAGASAGAAPGGEGPATSENGHGGGEPGGGKKGKGGDVIDAEFEEQGN
jgi:molecular chaperone DnaK